MSTLGQPHPEPAWKQEVARRLAAHKTRKGAPAGDAPAQPQTTVNSRAAEAAARVAARYAKAPSYTEMQAQEARLAVRAAEIATQVALQAQATAHEALAELHAAANEQHRGPTVVESITRGRTEPQDNAIAQAQPELAAAPELAPVPDLTAGLEVASEPLVEEPAIAPPLQPPSVYTEQIIDGQSFGIRWEPDTPVRAFHPKPAPRAESFSIDTEDWWTPAQVDASLHTEPITVEPEPGHANLIQFPRELVATRKMRPRLAEPVPSASTTGRQLSIFEVDPGAISTEPPAAQEYAPAPAWSDPVWSDSSWSDPAWSQQASSPSIGSQQVPSQGQWSKSPRTSADSLRSGADWSGIQLDEHPQVQERPEPARPAQRIFLAPLGYRLMATAVDGCFILSAFFAAAVLMAARMQAAPAAHTAEILAALGILFAGFLYNGFFFALGVSTPGMRYAGIALSTFDDESPTRPQLRRRLGAMALSLLPMGLGLAWSVFDEDHLSWHDRISQTYLRKR